jgi:probable FeS assembly SUF system protein SufT
MTDQQREPGSSVRIRSNRAIVLPRDLEVTIVPAGHRRILPEGERVSLLQALGATATVTTAEGEMARLAPADAADLGLIEAPAATTGDDGEFSVDAVWEAAKTVYDPEIPVDIVELGLVYRIDAEPLGEGSWYVDIDMSVTAPFCGMGDILRQDLHDAVAALPGVGKVDVTLVFDPPWDVSRLSEVARLELGMM